MFPIANLYFPFLELIYNEYSCEINTAIYRTICQPVRNSIDGTVFILSPLEVIITHHYYLSHKKELLLNYFI